MIDWILPFLFIHGDLLRPIKSFDWAWRKRRVGENEIFEIDNALLRLGTVNEAFLVNPSNSSHRRKMSASDRALNIKPRDVLGPRILALMFRQNAPSSASLHRHTDRLSCLDIDVALVDDGRPTPGDSFSLHILLEGFVMTLGMVEPTADAVVDRVLPLTTGSIREVFRLDFRTGVKAILRLAQTVD